MQVKRAFDNGGLNVNILQHRHVILCVEGFFSTQPFMFCAPLPTPHPLLSEGELLALSGSCIGRSEGAAVNSVNLRYLGHSVKALSNQTALLPLGEEIHSTIWNAR